MSSAHTAWTTLQHHSKKVQPYSYGANENNRTKQLKPHFRIRSAMRNIPQLQTDHILACMAMATSCSKISSQDNAACCRCTGHATFVGFGRTSPTKMQRAQRGTQTHIQSHTQHDIFLRSSQARARPGLWPFGHADQSVDDVACSRMRWLSSRKSC